MCKNIVLMAGGKGERSGDTSIPRALHEISPEITFLDYHYNTIPSEYSVSIAAGPWSPMINKWLKGKSKNWSVVATNNLDAVSAFTRIVLDRGWHEAWYFDANVFLTPNVLHRLLSIPFFEGSIFGFGSSTMAPTHLNYNDLHKWIINNPLSGEHRGVGIYKFDRDFLSFVKSSKITHDIDPVIKSAAGFRCLVDRISDSDWGVFHYLQELKRINSIYRNI